MHYLKVGVGFLVAFLAVELAIEGQITPKLLLKDAVSALLAVGVVWLFSRRKRQQAGVPPT